MDGELGKLVKSGNAGVKFVSSPLEFATRIRLVEPPGVSSFAGAPAPVFPLSCSPAEEEEEEETISVADTTSLPSTPMTAEPAFEEEDPAFAGLGKGKHVSPGHIIGKFPKCIFLDLHYTRPERNIIAP